MPCVACSDREAPAKTWRLNNRNTHVLTTTKILNFVWTASHSPHTAEGLFAVRVMPPSGGRGCFQSRKLQRRSGHMVSLLFLIKHETWSILKDVVYLFKCPSHQKCVFYCFFSWTFELHCTEWCLTPDSCFHIDLLRLESFSWGIPISVTLWHHNWQA